MNTDTKRNGLLFKFRLLLTVFIFVTMLLIGFAVYKTQARTYRERSINDIKSISTELEAILSNDKDNLQNYLNWVRVHHDELSIPYRLTLTTGTKQKMLLTVPLQRSILVSPLAEKSVSMN